MKELKTRLFDFNDDYDLLIIEDYPEGYHYVLLKQKANQIARVCNDCRFDGDQIGKNEYTGFNRGYPINIHTGENWGFNVDYLAEKLFLTQAETYFISKILRKYYNVSFKEFDE